MSYIPTKPIDPLFNSEICRGFPLGEKLALVEEEYLKIATGYDRLNQKLLDHLNLRLSEYGLRIWNAKPHQAVYVIVRVGHEPPQLI